MFPATKIVNLDVKSLLKTTELSMKNPTLIQLEAGFVNPVLIANDENSILVDTGRKGFGKKIIQQIEKAGLKPSDIKLIILTHTHFDHAGNARFLKEKTGAKILVHKNEAECLEKGYTVIPRGTMPFSKRLSWIGRNIVPFIGKYPSVKPDIIVEKAFDLSPWKLGASIIYTPGHTHGSVSVVLNDILLAGDMFFNRGLKGVFPPFADDPELLLKSWEKVFELGIKTIYPGHGARISVNKAMETYKIKKKEFTVNKSLLSG